CAGLYRRPRRWTRRVVSDRDRSCKSLRRQQFVRSIRAMEGARSGREDGGIVFVSGDRRRRKSTYDPVRWDWNRDGGQWRYPAMSHHEVLVQKPFHIAPDISER